MNKAAVILLNGVARVLPPKWTVYKTFLTLTLYGGCLTFDEEGLFFLPDVQDVRPQLYSILKKQGIKSLLVIKMPKSEPLFGLIGFEHDHLSRAFHAKELRNLSNISSILGMFIAEMRAVQKK